MPHRNKITVETVRSEEETRGFGRLPLITLVISGSTEAILKAGRFCNEIKSDLFNDELSFSIFFDRKSIEKSTLYISGITLGDLCTLPANKRPRSFADMMELQKDGINHMLELLLNRMEQESLISSEDNTRASTEILRLAVKQTDTHLNPSDATPISFLTVKKPRGPLDHATREANRLALG